jgi:hypothetical protein
VKSNRVFRVLAAPFSGHTDIARTFDTAREVDDYLCELRDNGANLVSITVLSQFAYVIGDRRYKSSVNTQETASSWLRRRAKRRALHVKLWRNLMDDSNSVFDETKKLIERDNLYYGHAAHDEFSYILSLRLRVASRLNREFGSEL